MSTIDLKDIQQKLYEGLKPSGWADKLKGFILSDDFYSILEQLLQESQSGARFTPVLKQLFRAFHECPYGELKVVIIAKDPYPKAGVADGLAFSCSNTENAKGPLKFIYKEIDNTVSEFHDHDRDLSKWSNQGVLLLNTALTTTAGKPGTHTELWEPFIAYLLDYLTHYNTGLLYVFMGPEAKEWKDSISKNNYKFFTTYPGNTVSKGEPRWDSGDLFNNINKVLEENYKFQITW